VEASGTSSRAQWRGARGALARGLSLQRGCGLLHLSRDANARQSGTILITNVPQELLSIDEALVLARCRGPLERCWKLWKQVGKVDTWRSAKPYRILTEIYAKRLRCLITRLPHAAGVLAGAQSQHGQSAASGAVDGSGAGSGRGRSRAVGDDGAAHLVLDGHGLYRQCASQEACGLSTGRATQAHPGLRLMPLG
jgi:hypothetical protein